jgi:hypothetical protein
MKNATSDLIGWFKLNAIIQTLVTSDLLTSGHVRVILHLRGVDKRKREKKTVIFVPTSISRDAIDGLAPN